MYEEMEYSKNQRTGSHEKPKHYKILVYPFGKYEIKIKLSPDNEFLGILEVKVNKDFLSYKQKMVSKGFHDVEEFYKE